MPAATHDGSIASLTEAWIVSRLITLYGAAGTVNTILADALVEVWPGSDAPSAAAVAEEMTKHRSPYVAVLFEGDGPVELEEGQQSYEAIYGIYIAVRNERPGAARKGDGTTVGSNLIRDLLRNAFHDVIPAMTANGYFTDRLVWRAMRLILQSGDVSVMRAEVMGRESPAA